MNIQALQQNAKALGDANRLRMLQLLKGQELCVCQIMGVLGLSQPLVSRHLAILKAAGFLGSRRKGKLVFYRCDPASPDVDRLMDTVALLLRDDPTARSDRERLAECTELQKATGRCDMELFEKYRNRGMQ